METAFDAPLRVLPALEATLQAQDRVLRAVAAILELLQERGADLAAVGVEVRVAGELARVLETGAPALEATVQGVDLETQFFGGFTHGAGSHKIRARSSVRTSVSAELVRTGLGNRVAAP